MTSSTDIQELYQGAEHLRGEYELFETYMAQKSFADSQRILERVQQGENLNPNLIKNARRIIEFAAKGLDKLAQDEIAVTYLGNLPGEENHRIRTWCSGLSKRYSPLMLLLEDTA